MTTSRFTFIWWGDGYFVYDGDCYLGKDDQVNLIHLFAQAGLLTRLDYEAENPDWGHESLSAFQAEYGMKGE